MRVLHVHSGNLYGGVETLLRTLAKQRDLCPAMEPEFALCFEGRLSDELKGEGVEVHLIGGVRISRPLSVRRARRALRQILAQGNYDAAVCHSSWTLAIFGPVIRSAGVALISWMHGPADGRHWLDRWACRTSPDLVVCNSRFTSTSVMQLHRNSPTEILFSPVELNGGPVTALCEERLRVRSDFNTDASDVVIIQVSRMEEWKGHLLHLEALGLLKDIPGWTCWIVGGVQRPDEIEYFKTLQRRVAELGVADRVRFTGERGDVPRLLAAADIFCQPNTGPEPFGLVFVEALAAGLPTVTTNIGGACEIIDDSCGLLVPRNNADALAQVLLEMIEGPARRAELGACGPKRVRDLCDPAIQMNRLHRLLENSGRREVAA
jgi:glycosyltransferase involved in cell wall biosynthesis